MVSAGIVRAARAAAAGGFDALAIGCFLASSQRRSSRAAGSNTARSLLVTATRKSRTSRGYGSPFTRPVLSYRTHTPFALNPKPYRQP